MIRVPLFSYREYPEICETSPYPFEWSEAKIFEPRAAEGYLKDKYCKSNNFPIYQTCKAPNPNPTP